MNKGQLVQVMGSVFDAKFELKQVPAVYNAVRVQGEFGNGKTELWGEVQQHLGGGRVRTIALKPTDGLVRGMKAEDTGAAISVPVGKQTLGRVLNVVGRPVDGLGAVSQEKMLPIHRLAPKFTEQDTTVRVLETGVKVIDLLVPFPRGGKMGLFGGAGVGLDRVDHHP